MQCQGPHHNDQIHKWTAHIQSQLSSLTEQIKYNGGHKTRLHTCQACIPHVISSLCNWNARTFHCTTGIITPCLSQWVIKQEQQATVTRLRKKKNSGGSHMQQYSIWVSSVPILIFHDLNLLDNKPLHFKSMYYISLDLLCIYGYINPSRTLNSFHCMRTIKTACKL